MTDSIDDNQIRMQKPERKPMHNQCPYCKTYSNNIGICPFCGVGELE